VIRWLIAFAAVGLAIFIGISDNGADVEREELRAENDALLRDLESLQRENIAAQICSGHSHAIKNLRINQLQKRLTAYEDIYGENRYSFGAIPE